MDYLSLISNIVLVTLIPWGVWVTRSIFKLQQEQAVAEQIYLNLKEDLNDLKEKLDKLIEIQTRAHLHMLKRYDTNSDSD